MATDAGLSEPVAVCLLLADIFDELGVSYLVGGSVASSMLGLPRATLDADLVADLPLTLAPAFVQHLGDAFYSDDDAIQDAIRRRASFNVIHLPTAFKVDVFVMRRDRYSVLEMSRRVRVPIGGDPPRDLAVATAEDMILQKLDWYRSGGGVSDRQWNDVLGLVKTRGRLLDLEYLRHWAAQLDLASLLDRALAGGV